MTRPSRAETLTVPTADFSCMSENKVEKISEKKTKNSGKSKQKLGKSHTQITV